MDSALLKQKLAALGERIGKTPVVDLGNGIYGKLEGMNPAGSIKDRAAYYIIKNAIESGELDGSGTVVEATSGNTGIGIAYVAQELGIKAVICMPDNMTLERRKMIEAYGAELRLTPACEGMAGAVAAARQIKETRGAFIANQFGNPSSIEAHYRTTAPELFAQTDEIKFVVCGVGSGGTAMGFAKYIKEHDRDCKVVAVEPEASPLLTKGFSAPHKIQGIGANFVPQILQKDDLDMIVTVDDGDSISAVKELYHINGHKCGISSGAAFFAARRLREQTDGKIAVILPDNGDRYSPQLYE